MLRGDFTLMSAHAIADKYGMGRLIKFPVPAGDQPDSEDRVAPFAVAKPLRALDRTPLKGAIDPTEWGVPRAFFIVHEPPTTIPTPDQKLVC